MFGAMKNSRFPPVLRLSKCLSQGFRLDHRA
jgi:hypothetical protein